MDEAELSRKVEEISRNGCAVGKVHSEQINSVCHSIDELKDIVNVMSIKLERTLERIDFKWMIGLILIILVAFMAGINVGEVIRGWIIRGGTGLP